MVTTTEILPYPPLQSYIRCYTLREFDTKGDDFLKPLPAHHEFTIAFTLRGSLYTYDTVFNNVTSALSQYVVGLQTASRGILIFNGDIRFFSIQFRPNGFYRLFGIPSHLITDNVFEALDIIPEGFASYNEQLNEATSLAEMKKLTDKFLMYQLQKCKTPEPSSITYASSFIVKNPSNANIKNLAYEANMSLRSFEKKFTEQVGIPPKLFARITRFNYALLMRIQQVSKSWTHISHECGYYDQMHFIKEFKEFAGDTPGNFYKTTPLPDEEYRKQ